MTFFRFLITSLMGDRFELSLRMYDMTIRLEDAQTVSICPLGERFKETGCQSCSRQQTCDSQPAPPKGALKGGAGK